MAKWLQVPQQTASGILIQRTIFFFCGRLLTILFAVTFTLWKLDIILLLCLNAIHLMSYKIMYLVGADSLKTSPTDILLAKSLLLGLVLYLFINC